ncbi:related to RNA-directed RNA polymerase [Phialocephala subalpina]|uniref:RNA-dependent RNA polymerase n=1 Tax=Phialocephala subalpina TaxID=576137 RepID=A0A1L7XVM5_9HELO|nr:related to RNA-directed RNA polymerase [Phialocephala subalpina]
MEVFIRNVPLQSGNLQLKQELRRPFEDLNIRSVDYNNRHGQNRAFLTFLHAEDGQRFLIHHGQNRRPPGAHRSTRINPSLYQQLSLLGVPIYCEKALHDASPVVLRGLAREEQERLSGKDPKKPKPSGVLPMTFSASSVSCGTLAFEGTELVFTPQYHLAVAGEAKFGTRSMMLTLNSGIRIDFVYHAVQSITTEIEPNPSFIFSMHQNPRFFEKIGTMAEMAEMLGRVDLGSRSARKGPERNRLPHLGPDHKPIAGHCFVYRIEIVGTTTVGRGLYEDTSTSMHRLEKAHETPTMIQHRTKVVQPTRSYVTAFEDLHAALSSLNCPFPFDLAFQVQKLAQNNYLPPSTVLGLFDTVTDILNRSGLAVAVATMRNLCDNINFPSPTVDAVDFELPSLIQYLLDIEEQIVKITPSMSSNYEKRFHNVATVHRALVTPTGIIFSGPKAESNNRILRKYATNQDSFLRVQFGDEDGDRLQFNQKVNMYQILHVRFKQIFEEGITIAGRTFEFLGFSHSSLRAHACWFVAPFVHNGSLLLAREIVSGLGDFTVIKSPAKCAARIGQVFSDTCVAIPISPEEMLVIPNVESNGHVFSDGVGTLSFSLLERAVSQLPRALRTEPTCLQIRYQGAKGMVSLYSTLQGNALRLRQSMIKFDGSTSNDLEICDATYKPLRVFLNRQFIKIMEDMGVDDSWFMDLQGREVKRLRTITDSPINASTFLKRQSIGEHFHLSNLFTGLSMENIDFRNDGFLSNVLEVAVLSELRWLKHKTRIPVPKGWHLHGIMDETGLLQEGEIFCVVIEEGVRSIVSGEKLIITRAPALHPGDIQLVKGIIPPQDSPLMQLANCVVFSQKGKRDLPSQLSGGDLDGDRFYVIWDERAIPKQTFEPAEYPKKEPIDIGRKVETSDMTDFFIDFMESDQLGRIAVGHRVLADQREAGTLDPDCITFAELHSDAVDFSKTGIAPDMTRSPRYKPFRPDFEAPGPYVKVAKDRRLLFSTADYEDPNDMGEVDDDFPTYRYYESDKIIGRLYRAIDERKIFEEIQQRAMKVGDTTKSAAIEALWIAVQETCKLIQWEHLLEEAHSIRDMYENCLLNIMKNYSTHPTRPLSELEVFAGTVLGKDGAPTRRQREASKDMKEQFVEDTKVVVGQIQSLEMSMACLAASLEEGDGTGEGNSRVRRGGEHLLSFKYLAAGVCLHQVQRMLVPDVNGVQLFEG